MDKGIPGLIPVRFHCIFCNAFIDGMEITVFLAPVYTGLPGSPGFLLKACIFFLYRFNFFLRSVVGSLCIMNNRLRMTSAVGFLIIIGLPVRMLKMPVLIGCNGILANAYIFKLSL